MKNFPDLGIQFPSIMLPESHLDLQRWAVIACDQYTSEPEYWHAVEKLVGEAPSTLHLTLPEVYLEEEGVEERIQRIRARMQQTLASGLLVAYDHPILVERTVDGRTRRGLVLALDLEKYDYSKGSTSLIRATEGTIIERLPPRMRIRRGAPLEFPHILVLIDDPQGTVIEPLARQRERLQPLYDVELMQGSGRLAGYGVSDEGLETGIIEALRKLADPIEFSERYELTAGTPVLLFAMGDGNHSLATAKAVWEELKTAGAAMDHPARYALVEIENLHDPALIFEPIHRVLFGVMRNLVDELRAVHGANIRQVACTSFDEMVRRVEHAPGDLQVIGMVDSRGSSVIEWANPPANLAVGSLQSFLDGFLKSGGADKIDYVHGEDVVARLGSQPGNLGFYLPAMPKSELFRTVILDGALPRKTFSMGEAHEKRFYMEGRIIAKAD